MNYKASVTNAIALALGDLITGAEPFLEDVVAEILDAMFPKSDGVSIPDRFSLEDPKPDYTYFQINDILGVRGDHLLIAVKSGGTPYKSLTPPVITYLRTQALYKDLVGSLFQWALGFKRNKDAWHTVFWNSGTVSFLYGESLLDAALKAGYKGTYQSLLIDDYCVGIHQESMQFINRAWVKDDDYYEGVPKVCNLNELNEEDYFFRRLSLRLLSVAENPDKQLIINIRKDVQAKREELLVAGNPNLPALKDTFTHINNILIKLDSMLEKAEKAE